MTVTDRKIHGTPAATSEAGDQRELVAALGMSGWRLTRYEGEVLRRSRFRPVFRYRVRYAAESGDQTLERVLIGKADYRHGGADTYTFMRRLRDAGFGTDDDTQIPEPIAYLEDLALLVQTEAPGRCLYEWLSDPGNDETEPAAAAGRWLGRLHGTSLGSRDGELPDDFEDRKLTGYCAELADVLPDQARRLQQCTARARNRLRAVKRARPVPTHGDYQPKNIYVDGQRVTVIDWDRGALAPAARDLGHFLGQCLTMAYAKRGSFEPGTRWNERFLDGYGETAPAGWEEAVAPYVARTILEVVYYKLVVKPVRDPSFVPLWLDQLEELLER